MQPVVQMKIRQVVSSILLILMGHTISTVQYTAFGKAYRGEIDGMSTSGVEVIDAISELSQPSAPLQPYARTTTNSLRSQ